MFEDTEQAEPESFLDLSEPPDPRSHVVARMQETADYLDAYPGFVESLPPRERAFAISNGLDKPDPDFYQVHTNRESDEILDFQSTDDIGEHVTSQKEADIVFRILGDLFTSKATKLHIACFLSMLGHWEHDDTVEAMAKRFGISKQRFSLVRSQIADSYGMRHAVASTENAQTRARSRFVSMKEWLRVIAPLRTVTIWINRRRADHPRVTSWPKQIRRDLRLRLLPFVDLYSELAKPNRAPRRANNTEQMELFPELFC